MKPGLKINKDMISHNGKDIRLDGENMVVVEFPGVSAILVKSVFARFLNQATT